MTEAEIRQTILDALAEVAPGSDPDTLGPDDDLRDELDLDSMDFLNFVIALHERLGVDIPEVDYQRLRTIEDAVAYLEQRRTSAAAR